MWFSNTNFWGYKLWLLLRRIAHHLQRMLCSSLTRMTLGSTVPRFTTVSRSHLNLAPMCGLHTSEVVERARQSTRIRKKKINDANKKKKEERLRKNPPPIPKKVGLVAGAFFHRIGPQVQLMLISKGLGKDPRPWRRPDNKPFPVDDVWAER